MVDLLTRRHVRMPWIVWCSPLLAAGCFGAFSPPPETTATASSASSSAEDTKFAVDITNHTRAPICRLWSGGFADTGTGEIHEVWKLAWQASTPQTCIAPGQTLNVKFVPADLDQTRSYAAAERLDTPPPSKGQASFTTGTDPKIVFEDASTLSNDAILDPGSVVDTPMTIEGRERQLAIVKAELPRKRAKCFAGLGEPTEPPSRVDVAGKWSCTSDDGGHAQIRVLGDESGYDVTQEIWNGDAHSTLQLAGHVHGKTLWATTRDGDARAQVKALSGGVRVTDTVWNGRECSQLTLSCTR
jgi:hypothetical protein